MKNIFLLDMDETLLDFKRAEEVNFFAALEKFGILADRAVYARFHHINDALWRLLEKGGITREALKVKRFALLFEECGYDADPEAVALAYWDNFPYVCFPFAGSADFLRELAARGRIYIVTNGGAVIQKQHLHDAGFEPFLAGVFISEEIGSNKPSKEYADYVKSHIPNFECARAVWLGDSLTSDMVCAKNAEVDFVLYAPDGVPADYDGLYATDYEQVLRLFAKLS